MAPIPVMILRMTFFYTQADKLRNLEVAKLTAETFFIGRIFETVTIAKHVAKTEIGDRFGHGYATQGNGIVCLNSTPTKAQVKRTAARFENDPYGETKADPV